ncbi:probable methyltransferase-like protein 15 homolog [Ischnura elegans]|uniref:probable methyltransferase-like protein 15 homolog n=1 Tax=Ischnura elegans TaxID=197161 RepID=UPI001ED8ADCF|nr:probable methyltransferase-like protein 15 homolog [Ischnura elegans]
MQSIMCSSWRCGWRFSINLPSVLRVRPASINASSTNIDHVLHVPVMAEDVLHGLNPQPGQTFIDMTFGAGGITRSILEASPDTTVFTLDRDPLAHSLSCDMAQKYPGRVVSMLGKFSELPGLLKERNKSQNSIDGIIFDLGCSSMQLDYAERGFSLSKDGPLDMRMDGSRFPEQPTAADVLAHIDEEDLFRIIRIYGEEKRARKIARAVTECRYTFRNLRRTFELKELVAAACENENRMDKLQRSAHSATKTFQALRIFVNNELNELNYALILSHMYLKVGGKIATLTFHSLEDRIVKRHFVGNVIENSMDPLPLQYSNHSIVHDKKFVDNIIDSKWKLVNKHVIVPSDEEVQQNPRSRSAKLRVAVKLK